MLLFPVLEGPLRSFGGFGGLSVLHRPTEGISDNPVRFLIRDNTKRPVAVLALSQPSAPAYVAEEIGKARSAKHALGRELGAVILDPIYLGELDGLTYSVTPWRQPVSSSRWLRRVQTAMLAPSLFRWLRRAVEATVTAPPEREFAHQFVEPLDHIATHPQVNEHIRRRASDAIDRLLSGDWQPRHVLDHQDLWLGNVLLDSPSHSVAQGLTRRFVIIDWRGANQRGYGVYDLLRLANSTGIGRRRLAREVHRHCEILGCALSDSVSQLLAALGHLGMNLECFPVDRYVALVERCYRTLSEVVDR